MAPTRPGYSDDKQAVLKRLRRIEGQVRGLQRMVDEDTYCIDVLTQISAATKALESVALELLDESRHRARRRPPHPARLAVRGRRVRRRRDHDRAPRRLRRLRPHQAGDGPGP